MPELCTFYWKMQFLEKCIFLEKAYFFPGFFYFFVLCMYFFLFLSFRFFIFITTFIFLLHYSYFNKGAINVFAVKQCSSLLQGSLIHKWVFWIPGYLAVASQSTFFTFLNSSTSTSYKCIILIISVYFWTALEDYAK